MRVAGEDEGRETGVAVFRQAFGDVLVTAHQAHGRPGFGLGETGPQVRANDQVIKAIDVLVVSRLPCATD
ncbi:hypothetical protein D3C84_1014920 [compost metagenome]